MTGKRLALGDVKALLGKVVGMEKMLDVFEEANLHRAQMASPVVDGQPIDQWRDQIWTALRRMFPAQPDAALREGRALTEEESPSAYVATQLRKWKMTMDRDIEKDPTITLLFRQAICTGMPATVKDRLEEVVGLFTMPHKQFVDNVMHAVDRHRKEKKRAGDQVKDLQKKLLQLQLEELAGKAKEKKSKRS
ncbi:hypothetical protein AAFF_G00421850 [Aldrovandia affinis]|uniref:Uncharacterized protein n=1 Tax=Aldrovandia affinis TaxID=143900 RepID=A0AAD7S9U0_9TELE|nr:hypothetical protein AAFF_G00421850 [Aldrovandia affinis]